MSAKIRTVKRVTCVLGILFIMLGLLPVGVLSRVGSAFAQEGVTEEPTPTETEEPAAPPTEETAQPIVEPKVEVEFTPEITLETTEPTEEPVLEMEIMGAAAPVGPHPPGTDPTTLGLPSGGNLQSKCGQTGYPPCTKVDEDKGECSVDGIDNWVPATGIPDVVVIKAGTLDIFFTRNSGYPCVGTYCVTWNEDSEGNVISITIERLCKDSPTCQEISNIQAWKTTGCPPEGKCPTNECYPGGYVDDGKCGKTKYCDPGPITPAGDCNKTCGYEGGAVVPDGKCDFITCPAVPIINYVWGDWGGWIATGVCGEFYREREVVEDANECGTCVTADGREDKYAPGPEEDCPTECGSEESWVSDGKCDLKYCDPVPIIDCVWGDWSEWVATGECGEFTRTRQIDQEANQCGETCIDADSVEELYLPPEEQECPTACGLEESWVSNGDCGLKYCKATAPCGGSGGGGGGGTTATGVGVAAVIPVTAAGGPTEELLVIPVTGVDLGFDFVALKQAFLFGGMLLFGASLLLEGASRKFRI